MPASPPSRRLLPATVLLGGASALAAVAVAANEAVTGNPQAAVWATPFVAAYVAGVVAVQVRPDNAAARRLLAFSCLATIWYVAGEWLASAVAAVGQAWWTAPANVALQVLGLLVAAALVALLAVYPDGSCHRSYEQRVVRCCVALALVVPALLLVAQETVEPAWVFAWEEGTIPESAAVFPDIASPLHVEQLEVLRAPLLGYLEVALGLLPLVGAVLVALRYRYLRADQRLQIRWPMYGVLTMIVLPVEQALFAVGRLSVTVSNLVEIGAFLVLCASIVIGLVKPDLLDVDRAVRRSLVYVVLWLVIAGAYVGTAAALGLAASGEGLRVAVAVTIVATLLFEPGRRHLARRAARWAYGEPVSGEELLHRLGATLEHTLDPVQLSSAIAAVAREGLGASWARLQLDDGTCAVDGADAQQVPALRAELRHAGVALGVLECGPREHGRLQASDQALLDTLAGQAALALHNARLASELSERLEQIHGQARELTASRARIVTAEESARRQIERDIHDGSQQELVALIARIGLARTQHGRGAAQLGSTLDALQEEARHALDNLRQLASGVHPAVLSDHGLVRALESRALRAPIPVHVECDEAVLTARFADGTEGAAYFFASEALANALKHADARHVRVRLTCSAGHLVVEVSDDGRGFDATAAADGGLRGLTDRVEALGGSLRVDSAPGAGTRVRALLPIGAPAGV